MHPLVLRKNFELLEFARRKPAAPNQQFRQNRHQNGEIALSFARLSLTTRNSCQKEGGALLQKRKPWKRAVPPPLNPLEGPEVGTLGELVIHDPNSPANSARTWDVQRVLAQCANLWAFEWV